MRRTGRRVVMLTALALAFAATAAAQRPGVVARTNQNPVVRKKAIFWLGQSDDPRALAFFEEILLR